MLLKGNNLNLIIWIYQKNPKFNDIIFFRNVKVMKNKKNTEKNVSAERKPMKHDN